MGEVTHSSRVILFFRATTARLVPPSSSICRCDICDVISDLPKSQSCHQSRRSAGDLPSSSKLCFIFHLAPSSSICLLLFVHTLYSLENYFTLIHARAAAVGSTLLCCLVRFYLCILYFWFLTFFDFNLRTVRCASLHPCPS